MEREKEGRWKGGGEGERKGDGTKGETGRRDNRKYVGGASRGYEGSATHNYPISEPRLFTTLPPTTSLTHTNTNNKQTNAHNLLCTSVAF